MSWRDYFLSRLTAGGLLGITCGRWLRVLWDNRFDIDWPYWPRATLITLNSANNSILAAWENLLYGARVRQAQIQPPLFVLGIWRSGTTHLRFAFPTTYEVFYPHTFLTTEQWNRRFFAMFLPKKRPQDNVLLGAKEPQEDEFALCSLTGRSFCLAWAFPRRTDYYDRFLTLRTAAEDDVKRWKTGLHHFVQKLSWKHKKPLILKSPGHTCRIKTLLELFPDARFVHIRRNPYDVFRSTLHTVQVVVPWWAMQRPDYSDLLAKTCRQYREIYDAFFEERPLIPKERFHEVGFEAVEADPIGQLREIYQALDLPDFNQAAPAVGNYLKSIAGYKKNVLPDLTAGERSRIAADCRRCFEEWGYPPWPREGPWPDLRVSIKML
jgi:hypothetical protein